MHYITRRTSFGKRFSSMHYVVVVGRLGAELFSYDTRNGEQRTLSVCSVDAKLLPSKAAALQRGVAEGLGKAIQTMLQPLGAPAPLIVALDTSLPDRFVAEVVARLGERTRRECRVSADGQFGFNEVVRNHLLLDDAHVAVAARPTSR